MIKINAPVPTSSGPNIIDLAAKHKLPHSGLLLDAAKARKAEIKAAIKPLRLRKEPPPDPLLPLLKGKEREQTIFETDSAWTKSSNSDDESEAPVESADSILEQQVAMGATIVPPPVAAQVPTKPPLTTAPPKVIPVPNTSGPPVTILSPLAPIIPSGPAPDNDPIESAAAILDR